MDNTKIFDITNRNLTSELGQITAVVVGQKLEDGKYAKNRCEVTGRANRYLYTFTRIDGVVKNVAGSVLLAAGFTQKQLDVGYSVGYYDEHPIAASGKVKMTAEEKAAALLA